VDPVPDPLLLRKNLVAPGIEPGPLKSTVSKSKYMNTLKECDSEKIKYTPEFKQSINKNANIKKRN
jgi:hypothetical protein